MKFLIIKMLSVFPATKMNTWWSWRRLTTIFYVLWQSSSAAHQYVLQPSHEDLKKGLIIWLLLNPQTCSASTSIDTMEEEKKYLWIEEPPYSSQPWSSETFKNLNSSKKTDNLYYSTKKNTCIIFIVYCCFCNMVSPNPQHHWWDDCKSIARGLDLKLLIIIWRDVEMLFNLRY